MPKKLKSQLEEENKLLLDRLNKLEYMLSNKEETKKEQTDIIPMTRIVKVISLYNGILNLKTSNRSDVVIFKFNFFGDVQPIFYSDIVKCIAVQQRFFKDGFCMILDEEVVKAHYLTKDYDKLLTKEQFDTFLSLSDTDMERIYKNLPKQQKMTLLERIAYSVNDNTADRNKVEKVSKFSHQDIYELANKLK
jgi:hypothetical protein